MASVSDLRTILVSAFSARGLQNGEQEFFEELMAHRPHLANLYDVGARNAQEKRELESGRVTINGRGVAVNADFARQTIFISEQLDVSERYVAGLLQDVMTENPNLTQEQCAEATILEFHLRRRHLADCLRYIFEATELAETTDAPQLYKRLSAFVRQQLLPSVAGPGRLSLFSKIFQEIHNLGNVIDKVQTARQNAGSNTVAPGAQNNAAGRLGSDILGARLESLKYERRMLANVLYILGRIGLVECSDLRKLVDWLAANSRHPMAYYILSTVMSALDLVDPASLGGVARRSFVEDASLISHMKTKLNTSADWQVQGLKATVLLKWTLFLTEARHRDSSLETKNGFKTDELEAQIWDAVQGDCFAYLLHVVRHLQKREAMYTHTSYASDMQPETDDVPTELPADDFRPAVFESNEILIRTLITQASSELRKIKQRQEDMLLAGTRNDRSRTFRQPQSSRVQTAADSERGPSRNDMATLFTLIGSLYSALAPERALHFWGGGLVAEGRRSSYTEQIEVSSGKLPAFLQWAVWSTQARDLEMTTALYDMLSGLAKGQQCSELAYNFLARGGGEVLPGTSLSSSSNHFNSASVVSWTAIFGLLEAWAAAGSSSRPTQNAPPIPGPSQTQFGMSQMPPHPPQQQQQLILSQQDVILAQSFLRLLSTVVAYSVAVRITISGHARFRAIPTLVSLIPLGIPLELKGAVFETLAAFCEPGAGTSGVEICRSVWTMMERLEVIDVRQINTNGRNSMPAVRGVEMELDEVETVYKLYPATLPFLRLLSTLIHTPKRLALRNRIAEMEPLNTVPDSLGHPYRPPGIGPFSSFVIDNVFLRIPQREYLRPSDRWRMNDLCLCFMERSLASYDLESLVNVPEDVQNPRDVILQLAIHPGYDIMKRVLTPSPLQASLLTYLVEGVDGFDKGLAVDEPFFRTTITRVLRMVLRILEIQDIYLDVLIPCLAELNDSTIVGEVPPLSHFTRLDQALSFTPDYVPAIAAYVAYPSYPELSLLSVKILTVLATSSAFPQLALLLERSSDSIRILDGFQRLMDTDITEDVDIAEAAAELSTGAGAADPNEQSDALTQAVRLAILELFIQNTQPNRPFPNISHFLLFGSASAEAQIQDPHALGARRSCIHSILDLLNEGVPQLKGRHILRRHTESLEPLFITLPAFAERCYRVVYHLCKHPRTSDFTMRYLRTREDFFARHLSAIPFNVPPALQIPYIEVKYNDGSRVTTTVRVLSSFMQLRSWILDLVALELHVLTNKGHHKSVALLLELLFGSEEDQLDEEAEDWENDVFQRFHEVGQSHMRIIEFVQSLDFDWSDSLTVQPVELQFLRQLNLQTCVRTDESGCEIVDRQALLSLLGSAKRALHLQGHIVAPSNVEQLTLEMTYILESCAIENHRREIGFATAKAYESWRRLLDMVLMKCFEQLPYDRRENMLFDLLHVIPPTLHSSHVQESTAALLAETMLSAITKLREDRRHQVLLQSADGDADAGALPAERLYGLLRSLVECIMDNSRIELVRGNLYASLINYLHLLLSNGGSQELDNDVLAASTLLSSRADSLLSDSLSLVAVPHQVTSSQLTGSSLVGGTLSILKSVLERLVAIVSRDAVDGSEVWKTVAFMLLDSLVRISHLDKQSTVVSTLSRQGFLSGFVHGLKESDLRLQAVLKPDPDDLNSLYVFESKMSLLVRMTLSRSGAERLLEARIIPTLSECDYLDARPEADQAFMDQDNFLPSAVQRYHQLFLPSLQVVSGMLVTLGPKHTTAANQALQFLNSHRDTIILLLKNEMDELSLSIMEEIRLLVSLSANVLQLVPKTELLSNTGFGSIHGAIAGLAARCLGDRHWTDNVKPQTESELQAAGELAPDYGNETKFRVAVYRKDQTLRREIIAYLGTASDFTEQDFSLVLSPVVTTPRQEERSTRFIATVPTIGDAIVALDELYSNLASTLGKILDLSAELASRDHIRVDNIREIVNIPNPHVLEDLDIRQKQSLIGRELERWMIDAKGSARNTLSSLEMLLLLLWRHLAFYGEGRHVDNPDLRGSISHLMRFASSPDANTLKSEAARKLAPVSQKLQSLELTEETIGADWHACESYLEIMNRRLKDSVDLDLDDTPDRPENES